MFLTIFLACRILGIDCLIFVLFLFILFLFILFQGIFGEKCRARSCKLAARKRANLQSSRPYPASSSALQLRHAREREVA
jgi:hypothetical protein